MTQPVSCLGAESTSLETAKDGSAHLSATGGHKERAGQSGRLGKAMKTLKTFKEMARCTGINAKSAENGCSWEKGHVEGAIINNKA